jgi:TonB family protein
MYWNKLAFVAALLAAFPAAMAQPAAAPAQPRAAPAWQVDWGRQYCTLVRPPDQAAPFFTAIATIPGSDSASIILIPGPSGSLPPSVTAVALAPGGGSYDVTFAQEDRGGRRVLALYGLHADFLDALAGATELQLTIDTATRRRIPLTAPRAGITALRRCTTDVAREWGIDDEALRALRQRPVSTNMFGLTSGDYPSAALRHAAEGRVIVRIAVSAEGRATECAPVATSGNAPIDATTCRVVLSRARFRPGLDAAGRPVATLIIWPVVWRLPGR